MGKRLLEDAPRRGRLFDVRIADAVGDMVTWAPFLSRDNNRGQDSPNPPSVSA
jgi:hypothetical protein